MLRQVSGGKPDPHILLQTLSAALLHDIGHGPFSHAIEKVTGIAHEAISAALLEHPDSEVHRILAAVDPGLPERVADLIHHRGPRTFYGDIVSGQIDADRLDYILRDGLCTGVKIHMYDFERIVSTLEATPDHLVVSLRAREAVEGYLLARFHMFKQVYLHKAARSAEKMLEAVMSRAAELLREDPHALPVPVGPLRDLLEGRPLEPMEFVELDDADIWVALKAWSRAPDPTLARLCDGLVNRRLYKTALIPDGDAIGAGGPIDAAIEAVRAQGGDPRYHLLVDRAGDTPYRPYVPGLAGQRPIMTTDPWGRLGRIEEHSDLIHLLGRDRYEVQRVCFPEDLRVGVLNAIEAASPRQQELLSGDEFRG
jgi:HD superfamily phosphohydrolase